MKIFKILTNYIYKYYYIVTSIYITYTYTYTYTYTCGASIPLPSPLEPPSNFPYLQGFQFFSNLSWMQGASNPLPSPFEPPSNPLRSPFKFPVFTGVSHLIHNNSK